MKSLYEAIFGTTAQVDIFDSQSQDIANQAFNSAYSQHQQNQLANAYNQQLLGQYSMMRQQPRWVYNGVECSLQEFADLMFRDDEEGKLMFILKHGGQ